MVKSFVKWFKTPEAINNCSGNCSQGRACDCLEVTILRDKERLKIAKKMMKKPPEPFEEIDLKTASLVPSWMSRAYRNNWYCVMVNENEETTHGKATVAMIQRHDDAPIHSWSELQAIKNEIFGKETVAVEYYPKQSELCDVANIYWLWIFPDGVLPLPLRKKEDDNV